MARVTSSGDRAPWRYSSAYPRIDVSGVRSSWDASAAKRRVRASDAVRASRNGCPLGKLPLGDALGGADHLVDRP
jgi:hypothetical protein